MGFFGDIVGSIGDIASDAGSILGDALSGGGYSQLQSNRQNVQLAAESRDWSERMSNSAYQRAVADMRAAGLNPMLAYQQGGASTPSPTTANVAATKIGAGIASSAKSAIELSSSQKNVAADTQLKEKTAEQSASQKELNEKLADKAMANAKESETAAERNRMEALRTAADTGGVKARAARDQMDTEVRSMQQKGELKWGEWDPAIKRLKEMMGIGATGAKILKPLPDINIGGGESTHPEYKKWKDGYYGKPTGRK